MKTGIVLSGCGVKDGSEIHEAVLTLLCLDQIGSEIVCLAPDSNQTSVVNHATDNLSAGEQRSMLAESARISRGTIHALSEITAQDIDALIFPGGFGAAKNLSSFALDGPECSVHPDVERIINELNDEGKPIGALCIAPVLLARVLGKRSINIQITIGNDTGVAEAITAMGATHIDCPVNEAVIDTRNHIVTSPAYMLAGSIKEVYTGAQALVSSMQKLCTS
ncbi:MAG: isoprenoid biosynthesis glyoxalase ElbB [Deltaproteobacteria bacterium]|nr:isoprenoid biosynthesis glyoxalase ElbB [Deltaproteobacteria bacterium]